MLPLLHKELIELAVHRRLYALRVVWAVVLCIVFILKLSSVEGLGEWNQNPLGVLGKGRELLLAVFWAEVIAVLVLMPAFTAGVLTSERERGSLVLLLLTPLGVWRVLLEKWLSRIVAVGSFLLMGLPLMAIAYAYGGFDVWLLARVAAILAVLCLQVSAVSLLVSARSRSTVGAFIGVLLAVPIYYLLPRVVPALLHLNIGDYFSSVWSAWNIFPVQWLERPTWMKQQTFSWAHGLAFAASILVPLILARLVVMRQSLTTGPGQLLQLFHRFDAWSEAVDARLGLFHKVSLPDERPLAWRAQRRRALTGLRYQIRLGLAGFVVVTLLALGIAFSRSGLAGFQAILTALTALMLLFHGAVLFAGERQDQTLQVLLTSPLTAREILSQKLVGLRRIHGVLLVIMLPVFLMVIMLRDFTFVWLTAAGNALLLPALIAWVGILVGLYVQRRQRAIVMALVALIAWTMGGFLVALFLFDVLRIVPTPREFLPLFSPLIQPLLLATDSIHNTETVQTQALIHFIFYSLMFLGLRWWGFRIVDTRLHH